jgi:hypothetical protein
MRALPLAPAALSRTALWLGLSAASLATTACGGGAGPADAGAKAQSTAVNAAAAAAGPTASAVAADEAASAASEPAAAASSTKAGIAAVTPPAGKSAKALSVSAARATVTTTTSAATAAINTGGSVGVSVAASPATMAAVSGTPSPTVTAAAKAASNAATVYTGPITISKGGSYSGNWESKDPALPAVSITTTDPVTIQNCNLRSVASGIQSVYGNSQITVRNCKAQMLLPKVAGKSAWRFVSIYMPRSLVAENNEISGGGGFYVDGAGKPAELIRIRYNSQTNVDGRQSDGKGGFAATFNLLQFVQLNNVQGIKDGEIAWNQVINQPGASRVEDNINLYLTRGLAARKFPVQNNYIQGAYPANPAKDGFSGGGIIVDGSAKTADSAAGYLSISDNQVVSTSNYGVAIAAGVNNELKNNRVVSTGLLPTGERIAAANVGVYIWDIAKNAALGSFAGNVAAGNRIYWINSAGQRNDAWFPDCAVGGCASNLALVASTLTVPAAGATLAPGANKTAPTLEDVEFANWRAKLKAAGLSVGLK